MENFDLLEIIQKLEGSFKNICSTVGRDFFAKICVKCARVFLIKM